MTYLEWLQSVADQIAARGWGAHIKMRSFTPAPGPVFPPAEAIVAAIKDDVVHVRLSSAFDIRSDPSWYAEYVLQSIPWTRDEGMSLIAQFSDVPQLILTKPITVAISK